MVRRAADVADVAVADAATAAEEEEDVEAAVVGFEELVLLYGFEMLLLIVELIVLACCFLTKTAWKVSMRSFSALR